MNLPLPSLVGNKVALGLFYNVEKMRIHVAGMLEKGSNKAGGHLISVFADPERVPNSFWRN